MLPACHVGLRINSSKAGKKCAGAMTHTSVDCFCMRNAALDRFHLPLQSLSHGVVQMLKFTSGKTGHEDVKLLMEAFALIPVEEQWRHPQPVKPMEIDNK